MLDAASKSSTLEKEATMNKVLVFDLPMRMIHWLLAALFLGAFVIATTVDDESATFAVHAVLGAGAVALVLLRLVWALIGSRHARFGALALHPAALARYLADTLAGRGGREAGHNPATSWFMLLIFAVVLGLGVTGWRMGRGDESVEELHEILAWTGGALFLLHVAGVLWHLARQRENLVATMITGRREVAAHDAIPSARPGSALALLAVVGGLGAVLISGFDARAGRLTLPGLGTLAIGEAGEAGAQGGEAAVRGNESAGEDGEAEKDDD
ncbi:MAG: cytochrome b/b6 domain-containing protein [Rhodocyclaceae bacterium]|nr:cytochrome b/b6 domain-containing protein [Rhodocyclaceae bacterium]